MNSDDLKLSRRIQNLVPLPVMLTLSLLVLVPAPAGAASFAGTQTDPTEWTYTLTFDPLDNYAVCPPPGDVATIRLSGLAGVVAATPPTSTDFPAPLDSVNLLWMPQVSNGGTVVTWTHQGPGTGNFSIPKHAFGFKVITGAPAVNGTVKVASDGFSRDVSATGPCPVQPADDRDFTGTTNGPVGPPPTTSSTTTTTLPTTTTTLPAVAPWVKGDVFAAVGNGMYQVYDNTGVLKDVISDGLGGLTAGCAFNASFTKLYTTNFSNTKVVVYGDPIPHPVSQIIDTRLTFPSLSSESVVFDAAGSFYVGHADGDHRLHKYDAAGNLLMTFSPATERRGTDWNDLAADQRTMFYTSEGGLIKRFDVGGNVQLPDFASIGGLSFALRLLLPADGRGGLVVANFVDIKRLDSSGTVVQTYDAPGEDGWFSLNLDPNGTSLWAGDVASTNFYRFNLASGAVEVGPIGTGAAAFALGGLCVKGEFTSQAPEAQPAGPQLVCGGTCNVSITCNILSVVGIPCANQVNLFVRRPPRSGTSSDSSPQSDSPSAKVPGRMIRFAFGVANVPPGQTAPVKLKLTKTGRKIARSGARRLRGIMEIRNVAGPVIGSTPVRIRLKK